MSEPTTRFVVGRREGGKRLDQIIGDTGERSEVLDKPGEFAQQDLACKFAAGNEAGYRGDKVGRQSNVTIRQPFEPKCDGWLQSLR